jgi:hypothetical protein
MPWFESGVQYSLITRAGILVIHMTHPQEATTQWLLTLPLEEKALPDSILNAQLQCTLAPLMPHQLTTLTQRHQLIGVGHTRLA